MNIVNKKTETVAAVVLTFNREEMLKKVIYSMKNQTTKVDEIIVVFQGGATTTVEWLKQEGGLYIHQQENQGSAGGFTRGIEIAIEKGYDWVWITDDDAIPELDALEHLTNCKYFDSETTGFLSSVVVNGQGQTYMSPSPDDANKWYRTVLKEGCVPVTLSAWPGCLVSAKAVMDFGLPIAEYFFYDEDFEFTSRLARQRASYCVINSVIVHYQEPSADLWLSPRRYKYFVRNRFATIRFSGSKKINKIAKVWLWVFKILGGILIGKIPVGAVVPMFRGLLFFRPKIKYPVRG
ncbi:MAG: glycosyltransferase [Bacteroidia bacterium]|nr:glycosyltransferase [Methylotenera sp.]